MTRTTRRDYCDRPIRDGQHGRRCPEPNCATCAASRPRPDVDDRGYVYLCRECSADFDARLTAARIATREDHR